MYLEKELDRIQNDLHLLYTNTVEDIKFAKTQMWQITFFAISLMLALAFLRNSFNSIDVGFVFVIGIIALFAIVLIIKIQRDIHKKYRTKITEIQNISSVITNVFPVIFGDEIRKYKKWHYDISYWLILIASILAVAVLIFLVILN